MTNYISFEQEESILKSTTDENTNKNVDWFWGVTLHFENRQMSHSLIAYTMKPTLAKSQLNTNRIIFLESSSIFGRTMVSLPLKQELNAAFYVLANYYTLKQLQKWFTEKILQFIGSNSILRTLTSLSLKIIEVITYRNKSSELDVSTLPCELYHCWSIII